jgi:predicted dinucleotide-binding enzyme
MRVGIIGAGRIGGNIARLAAAAGHEVTVAFSRDPGKLATLALELGGRARTVTVAGAVADADVTVLSVPWSAIDEALRQAGPLNGAIIVDTTNTYGPDPGLGQTSAAFNATRMPGARYTKTFNTLTAGFQAEAAGRRGDERVVQWLCGDDAQAKDVVAGLVESLGYRPVDLGGVDECAVMEAPRRHGAVYGEEYRLADAGAVVAAVRTGRAIPPTPTYL